MDRVVNFKDLKIFPIDDADIEIIEWCPGDGAVNPPEQVHVMIRLGGSMRDYGFAIRLKTRAGVERFINTIKKHADSVWPRKQ